MKIRRICALVLATGLMGLAGCSGTENQSTGSLPPEGLPPGAPNVPMPEPGKRYDNPQPADRLRDGGTLRLAIGAMPTNFNPFSVYGNTSTVTAIDRWTMPDLWAYDVSGGIPEPNTDFILSSEVIDESPETVKFTINPDARWNNGDPITWRAFRTTWLTSSGQSAEYLPATTLGYSSIKEVRMGDNDKEAVVEFEQAFYPYQLLFERLLHPKNDDPAFFNEGWAGDPQNDLRAGPFMVESYDEEQLTLVRNPNWWGDPPKLDRITYRAMEAAAAINAFQNGELDAVGIGSADQLQQLANTDDVLVRRGFGTSVSVYSMGQDSELFQNSYAREAFVRSIDRRQLAEIQFQGLNWQEDPPGSSVMYPWQDNYTNNLDGLEYDVDAATGLMEEHGWSMNGDGLLEKDGKTARFTYVLFGDTPMNNALARAQQAMAKEAGFDMQIEVRSQADLSTTIQEGTYDLISLGWGGSIPFGFAWQCMVYCSSSPQNFSRMGTEELDRELQEASTISDVDEAAQVGAEAEATALRLFGIFPLHNGPDMVAVSAKLANFGPAGFLTPDPVEVGWEK